MTAIRQPAVAGMFYPDDTHQLHTMVTRYVEAADTSGPTPKALIVPHAGYIYSGAVAASGYARIVVARHAIKRVVLLGPTHFVPLWGLAVSSADVFATPLGNVLIDRQAIAMILALPQVSVVDAAHACEHSLEVQLPFLQTILADFTLVPLAVGEATPAEVGEILEALWGGPETLVVISSDLSHYYDYETAQQLDRTTTRAIERLRPQDIGSQHACGRHAVCGLLHVAQQYGLQAQTVDVRNSGDTAGPRDHVVGYGAYVFTT